MIFYLLIGPLDAGEEQEQILESLKSDKIIPACEYDDASLDSNYICINICSDSGDPKLRATLSQLSKQTLQTINELDLDISLNLGIYRVEQMKTLDSGMVCSFSKHSFFNQDLLQILTDKKIDLSIAAFDFDKKDKP